MSLSQNRVSPADSRTASQSSPVTFPRQFAPAEGRVAPVEKPYRSEICLNGSWQFQPIALPASSFRPNAGTPPALPAPQRDGWDKQPIKIPSPWNVNAFNQGDGGDFRAYPSYPAAWSSVQMGWLRRMVTVPANWKGKRLRLRFDAIAGNADIYVNGKKVGENFELYLPAEYDVTDAIRVGAPNEILVGVRKASLFNHKGVVGARTYPGGSMWAQAIVGIWQDVFLEAVPVVHVADQYIQSQVSKGLLTNTVTLRNDGSTPQTVQVTATVSPWVNQAGKSVLDAPEPRGRLDRPVASLSTETVEVPAGKTVTVTLKQSVGGKLRPWTPETPNLYGMVVSVSQGKTVVDQNYVRFGWREFTIQGNQHLLNGKPLELRGDSWHFMGIPQMTRRYAWAWYKALKDANGNAVRLHAQPYPEFYLDMADEMGVCVLDETAIWGSDAGHAYDDPAFWERSNDHVRRLILRDRNHASVFGWSLSNEVAWYIDRKFPVLVDRLKQGWRDWLADAQKLDPSRPWISADGDNDAMGIMPTSVSHYAKDIARPNKPFGQGETGGAYYATPKYAAQFAGPRAYESQLGRMEGIAREAYELIRGQRAVKASYASVFNLVWYGLQPLELGLPDTRRPYNEKDGIFFTPHRENVPGVQPERLGPYSTTLNPGFDPRLPLYKTWPLAEAIKAAYAQGGPVPSPWDHFTPGKTPDSNITAAGVGDAIAVLAAESSLLPNQLQALGATIAENSDPAKANFIVIDGIAPPANLQSELGPRVTARVREGATCLVLGVSGSSLSIINSLLPQPAELTTYQTTSLLIQSADPLVTDMNNADFYFTESGGGPVIRNGLAGPLVRSGRVILAACPTDWKRWNNQPEPIKTAATVRSEREAKQSGAALVEAKAGAGRYLVTTIDLSNPSMNVLETLTRMMRGGGVRFQARKNDTTSAFDNIGRLYRVLACGRFPGANPMALYETDHVGIKAELRPDIGTKTAGQEWIRLEAGGNGAFDFRKAPLKGPEVNAAVYLSFWVWSPRPLDNLLVEPNLPRLDLLMGSDDGCQVWLNSRLIQQDRGIHPMVPDSIVAEGLPLQRGWNHFVVKVVQGEGEWSYAARLRSSDARFLLSLRSSATAPDPNS